MKKLTAVLCCILLLTAACQAGATDESYGEIDWDSGISIDWNQDGSIRIQSVDGSSGGIMEADSDYQYDVDDSGLIYWHNDDFTSGGSYDPNTGVSTSYDQDSWGNSYTETNYGNSSSSTTYFTDGTSFTTGNNYVTGESYGYYDYGTNTGSSSSYSAITYVSPTVRYVKTNNGGRLNVRSRPSTSGSILGRLEYGKQITVQGYAENGTWAAISYNGTTGYVLARYLSATAPYTVRVTPTPVPIQYTQSYTTPSVTYNDTASEINAQFASMTKVNSYQVTVHPTRVGGWVNFRWAPSLNCSVIRYCYEGETLMVIAQNNVWLQVQDPVDGYVGFIQRNYAY